MNRVTTSLLIAGGLCAWSITASAGAQVRYHLHEIGKISDVTRDFRIDVFGIEDNDISINLPFAISNTGECVGYRWDATNSQWRAWLYAPPTWKTPGSPSVLIDHFGFSTGMHDLTALADLPGASIALDINNNGQIAGGRTSGTSEQAVVWTLASGDATAQLITFTIGTNNFDGSESLAYGLNDASPPIVVGYGERDKDCPGPSPAPIFQVPFRTALGTAASAPLGLADTNDEVGVA